MGSLPTTCWKGLRGAADSDRDRLVSLGEIMEFVREKVKDATQAQQIPAIGPTSFDRTMPLVVVPEPEDNPNAND